MHTIDMLVYMNCYFSLLKSFCEEELMPDAKLQELRYIHPGSWLYYSTIITTRHSFSTST